MDEHKTSIMVMHFESPKNQPKTFVFALTANGHDAGQMTVAIDQHYPKKVAEQVARTFLYRRLAALAREAEYGALADDELKKLWARFKPAHYPK